MILQTLSLDICQRCAPLVFYSSPHRPVSRDFDYAYREEFTLLLELQKLRGCHAGFSIWAD